MSGDAGGTLELEWWVARSIPARGSGGRLSSLSSAAPWSSLMSNENRCRVSSSNRSEQERARPPSTVTPSGEGALCRDPLSGERTPPPPTTTGLIAPVSAAAGEREERYEPRKGRAEKSSAGNGCFGLAARRWAEAAPTCWPTSC
jgi:hypothetical protein